MLYRLAVLGRAFCGRIMPRFPSPEGSRMLKRLTMTPELWDYVLEVSVSEPESLRRLPRVGGLYLGCTRNRDRL